MPAPLSSKPSVNTAPPNPRASHCETGPRHQATAPRSTTTNPKLCPRYGTTQKPTPASTPTAQAQTHGRISAAPPPIPHRQSPGRSSRPRTATSRPLPATTSADELTRAQAHTHARQTRTPNPATRPRTTHTPAADPPTPASAT